MSTVSLLLFVLASAPVTGTATDPKAAITTVLDDWHKAAAQADEARYFGYFTPDAVYMGTDATERWTRDEFRAWSKPYFSKGKAWSFKAVSRHITVSKDGAVAWFDETLDTPNLGPSRGSGVLVKDGGTWKIAQYNLSIPIPNDLMDEVVKRIQTQAPAKSAPAPAPPAPKKK
ncbi:nuclear transport factor 2 family protein [Myxococcus llanfairpwllgwyngyllgogerychwyrndrobwllllantysiliogogogochensis]|uniref:Nuclear transport factor 2 family protein n=1 Tax=Myxococcus llanfairpwllgwyngyllgogerychwyrndrobwllllantysiliogogogochensis TaxID=2590453 RepID=A0A540X9R2_9BACT|nr:nuclear transport factor 2 family protein [Myxococcus llanfairpwllgwyngyllgogerychwyrndrobwllllantysiliogogogochensis]TQF17404.1 nuclear transport factor 2 family protein [Myxococcus llanfairpwllgwyngyllgogerychwyrndrobwllllantysiliogogogochensis]